VILNKAENNLTAGAPKGAPFFFEAYGTSIVKLQGKKGRQGVIGRTNKEKFNTSRKAARYRVAGTAGRTEKPSWE